MKVSLRKSVTLVELIISIVLLGVIILGATAFHLSSERFLSSSEKKTSVLNELAYILQHLHKNVLVAVGDIDHQGIKITGGGTILQLYQGPTRSVEYRFGVGVGSNEVIFQVNPLSGGPAEVLSRSFIDLGAPDNFSISLNTNDGGVAVSNLVLQLDTTLPIDPSSNPQVTTIDAGGGQRTIYFYSLAHSWK